MFDVLIAGYGPVGMVAACLLGRAGYRVGVFERHKQLYLLSRVGGIKDDIARIFQEIGIVDTFWPKIHIPTHSDLTHGDTLLFRAPLSAEAAHGWPELILIYQPDFERELDILAKSLPNVTVVQGETVVGVRQDDDGVDIDLQHTTEGTRRSVRGRYLFACDGGNSFVRQVLDIPNEHLGFEQDWLIVDALVKRPRPTWSDLRQMCDPEQPGLAFRMGRDHRRFAFMVLPGQTLEEVVRPEHVWRLFDIPEGGTPDELEIIRAVSFRFTSVVARSWREGRIFLAGDSAHQMPPILGQGMASGIRDAHSLSWKLGLVLQGLAPESFLDTYRTEREPNTRAAINESNRLARIVIERDPEKVRQRDEQLIGLTAAQETKQLAGYRLPGLAAGFIAGGADARGAGEIFVQGVVAYRGREGRFDDVVGRGPMILTRSGDAEQALSEDARRFWRSIGGRILSVAKPGQARDGEIADVGGWYGRFFDEFGADVIVKRPDYYVFGLCATVNELPALIDDFRGWFVAGSGGAIG